MLTYPQAHDQVQVRSLRHRAESEVRRQEVMSGLLVPRPGKPFTKRDPHDDPCELRFADGLP